MFHASSIALIVASPLLGWTQEQCSRILVISTRYGFWNPMAAILHAFRKVFRCMCGEQDATTTAVRPSSLILFRIICCPGSEHMYLYESEQCTPGSFPPVLCKNRSATFSQSALRARTFPLFCSPHQQVNTPVFMRNSSRKKFNANLHADQVGPNEFLDPEPGLATGASAPPK